MQLSARASVSSACLARHHRRAAAPIAHPLQRRATAAAAGSEEPGPSSTSSQQQGEVREFKAWGVRVIESNEVLPGPEDQKDFWEGEQFQSFGEAMEKFFLPGLVVLGIVCGGIAAQTYNQGADVFLTSPTPDSLPQAIPASKVLQAPTVNASE